MNEIKLARLATIRAKPNGIFIVEPKDGEDFVTSFETSQLPTVGTSTAAILKTHGIMTVKQLREISLQTLQRWIGRKHGETLFHFARGIDDRPIKMHHVRFLSPKLGEK